MTVTTSTCFLCHFKGEPFNEGLGACTRCHQIPDEKFDLGGGVTFTHDLAYEKGVDCANCHGDVIRGNGEVPRNAASSATTARATWSGSATTTSCTPSTSPSTRSTACSATCRSSTRWTATRSCTPPPIASPAIPTITTSRLSMLQGQRRRRRSPRSPTACWPSASSAAPATASRRSRRREPCSGEARPQMCSLCHDAATVQQFEAYHVQAAGVAAGARSRHAGGPRGARSRPSSPTTARRPWPRSWTTSSTTWISCGRPTTSTTCTTPQSSTRHWSIASSALCRELKVAEPKVDAAPAAAHEVAARISAAHGKMRRRRVPLAACPPVPPCRSRPDIGADKLPVAPAAAMPGRPSKRRIHATEDPWAIPVW